MPQVIQAPSRCVWCAAVAYPTAGRLSICDACGAASTYPAPDEAELQDAYASWYRPVSGRFSSGGDELLRRSRALLAGRIDRRAPAGPVLDVGCGEGALLDALRARGRDALGTERRSSRPDVRAMDLTELEERSGVWAAIIFWHSLEHLREPAAALEHACSLLADGGIVVIAIPNRESWQSRLFGEDWLALDIPRHLVHLPASALSDRLRALGLCVERLSYWRGGQVMFGWLHGIVRMLPGHPDLYDAIRRPEAQQRRLTPRRRAAVLGAGAALAPAALALAAAEVCARAGGTVYVEARKL
jgi:SAM-dependent methyltransferase